MNKMKRSIYIDNIDVDKAKERYYKRLAIKPQWEEIDVLDSLNRVSFEAQYAKISSPNYNAAAMDGILVESMKTIGATTTSPKLLEEGKDFIYVNTGNMVVEPYDAVIMIEDVIEIEKARCKFLKQPILGSI